MVFENAGVADFRMEMDALSGENRSTRIGLFSAGPFFETLVTVYSVHAKRATVETGAPGRRLPKM
jgi:hypothetical protein